MKVREAIAAGALGIASRAGFDKLLMFDMGGTSTDVALIESGGARRASARPLSGATPSIP